MDRLAHGEGLARGLASLSYVPSTVAARDAAARFVIADRRLRPARPRPGVSCGTALVRHESGEGHMAEDINLDALRQEVKQSDAAWEPGETSMTKLSPEERQRR